MSLSHTRDHEQAAAELSIGRVGYPRRAGLSAGIRVDELGSARAEPGGLREPEAASRGEADPVEGALHLSGAPNGEHADPGSPDRSGRGRVAPAREAIVLLLRVRADPKLRGREEPAGSLRGRDPILEDVGEELPGKEMLGRFAVRERSVRARDGASGRRCGRVQRGFRRVHEVSHARLLDSEAGAAGAARAVPLLQGARVEHDRREARAEERVEAAWGTRGEVGLFCVCEWALVWAVLAGAIVK